MRYTYQYKQILLLGITAAVMKTVTKFKSKKPEGKTPEEIYREYQTLRDDIPATIYASIKSATEQATHEDNIALILQRAKAFQPNTINTAVNTERESFVNRIKNYLFGDSSQPRAVWGTAFASLAIAVIAIPFAMNFSGQGARDSQLAYFDGCANCISYVENAAVSTRSAMPGLNKVDPNLRFEARLGRIFADLKILQSINGELDQQDTDAQVKRLRALPSNLYSSYLALELSKSNITHGNLVSAIQSDSALESSPIFLAAESLEIANITARRARDEKNDRDVEASFRDALAQFEQAAQSARLKQNTLAQNTLAELNKFNIQSSSVKDQAQLKKLISLYTQALQSLGI